MRNLTRNRSGMILLIVIMVIAVLVTLSVAFVSRAVHEKAMADREVNGARSLYTSEAGAQAGLNMIDTLINTNLLNTINNTSAAVVSAKAALYVSNNDPLGFLVLYTKSGSTALLTLSGSEAVYNGTATTFDSGTYSYAIKLSAKGSPSTVSANVWDFPYYYKIQATGTKNNVAKKFTLNGDFTVRVQKDNFARYALFTNTQTTASGSTVWFTNTTNFSGPVFTNGKFNFTSNPSATFYGSAKQVSSVAQFNNNGNPVNLNADSNGTVDVPTFVEGFQRSATAVTMPTSTVESSMVAEATAGGSYNTNGIYVPVSGSTITGGIYVKGDATVALSVNGSDQQVYTITQGATTKTITVNRAANQTVVSSGGVNTTYTGKPDGVDNLGDIIYVSGNITNLGGTVQKDNQMIIAAHSDAIIQNNILYSQYTPAVGTVGQAGYVPPSADGTVNLLGVMSWAGNVRIGTSAPNNINIHATLMANAGEVAVDNYNSGSARGVATVLGGVISKTYGPFATANASTGVVNTGYGRKFTYDTRMETQYTPPYFPTMNTFIAFTNDINDKKFWQTGGF